MVNEYVKNLIDINKIANEIIPQLEGFIKVIPVTNDKEKADFGNACIMLNGFRNIANASEAMLINEEVLKDDNGNFYQKIKDEGDEEPVPAQTPEKKDE